MPIWCPTGEELLATCEAEMLAPTNTPRYQRFIDIGACTEDLSDSRDPHHVNTIFFNPGFNGLFGNYIGDVSTEEGLSAEEGSDDVSIDTDDNVSHVADGNKHENDSDATNKNDSGSISADERCKCRWREKKMRKIAEKEKAMLAAAAKDDEEELAHAEVWRRDRRPIVVLAHGFGSGSGFWSQNIDAMAERYRVIAFDWIGFGRSSRPRYRSRNCPESAEKWFVSSLARWVDKLSEKGWIDEEFVLVGHSMGGYLSAGFAMEHPANLAGLVLVSPVGVPEFDEEVSANFRRRIPKPVKALAWVSHRLGLTPQSYLRAAGPLGPSLIRKQRKAMAERFSGFYDDHQKVVTDYSYHVNVAKCSGETAFWDIVNEFAYAKRPLVHRAQDIKVNTSFMYGGSFDWMSADAARVAISNMTDIHTSLHLIPNAGHNLFADNADAFNATFAEVVDDLLIRHHEKQ